MLVYGDAKRIEDPREKAARIRAGLKRLETVELPIERHALLAEMFIEAGELEQGFLDWQFRLDQEERTSRVRETASRLTRVVAEALLFSFKTCGNLPATASIQSCLETLSALELPEEVSVSVPEGYAFYGLYPESYFCAAEALRERGPLGVVGIRSIGTSLAAAVAVVAGDRASVVSVRPVGHPFSRAISIGQQLETEVLSGTGFAVVDEGPGLSGSSFGCVADWLEDHGAASEDISFFPSHRGGLGPYASERHRSRWDRVRRHVVEFEQVFTSRESRWPLARWTEDLTGEPEGPLEDLSAGRWREHLFTDRSQWPAADVQGERRKYLLPAGGRRWLLKFAGLGRYGREKLAMAEALGEAGLIPPVAGLRYGFLVGPWIEGARPLPLAPEVERRTLLDSVARYLAFRVSNFPADNRGASPTGLYEMASFNAERALGPDLGEAVQEWQGHLLEIARLERPVLTDNKMHAWEWLVTPEGKILKADALDHHCANDLVGPQDVAWDLVAAAVELDLDETELARLAGAVACRAGVPRAEPVQLGFYTVAYLAFQIGRHTLAAEALESSVPAESAGLRSEVDRYAGRLRRILTPAVVRCSPYGP